MSQLCNFREVQQVFSFDNSPPTCSFPHVFAPPHSLTFGAAEIHICLLRLSLPPTGLVFQRKRLASKMMSRSYTRLGKNTRSKRRAKEPSSFNTMHLRKKFSFMKVLGLQFALPFVERVKSENNNDESSVDNNENVNVANQMQERQLECYECKASFKTRKSYDTHLKKKHGPYNCKICSRKFLHRRILQKHKMRHQGNKPYTCSKCNKRFECLDALTAHIRRHLGKLPYICKVCKDGFNLHLDYKQHLLVHEMKVSDRLPRKLLYCSDCDKVFHKPCDLERHTRVHTGERPFICAVCGNRFQQAHNLTKHMVIHTRERRFQCEICSKLFGRNDVLTRHMLTHAIEKPFSCHVCEKTFARALQLTQHTMKHHEN